MNKNLFQAEFCPEDYFYWPSSDLKLIKKYPSYKPDLQDNMTSVKKEKQVLSGDRSLY